MHGNCRFKFLTHFIVGENPLNILWKPREGNASVTRMFKAKHCCNCNCINRSGGVLFCFVFPLLTRLEMPEKNLDLLLEGFAVHIYHRELNKMKPALSNLSAGCTAA